MPFSKNDECQDFSYPSWIKKNKVKYSIVFLGSELKDESFQPSKYIVLTDLSKKQKKYIKELSIEEWKCLLKCEDASFSTNLILYSILEKDALLLLDSDEKEWNNCCREDDLGHWIEYLSKNKENFIDKVNEVFK
jgi:hypothetical protein